MHNIENNLTEVRRQIQAEAKKCGRSSDNITLLAVSKKHPATSIQAAYECGQRHFGENYVQEACEKIEQVNQNHRGDPNNSVNPGSIVWHFIGPIQSNKTKLIAQYFHWVHSIERLKIAQRLNEQRPEHLAPLNVCIQINIDNETTKSGIAPEEAMLMASEISKMDNLCLRGLMAIPAKHTQASSDSPFARMHELFSNIKEELKLATFDTLSMGMSADMGEAIANGSNMVRIGTAIFGQRE